LKNQFRTLDDDEVEFLDSVLESTRAKEAAVEKETSEQLEAFRKQREEAEKALLDEASNITTNDPDTASVIDQETWSTTSKKRRRAKDKDTLVGSKLRKMSSSTIGNDPDKKKAATGDETGSDAQFKETPLVESLPDSSSKISLNQPHSSNKESPIIPAISQTPHVAKSALGLGGYSSDED